MRTVAAACQLARLGGSGDGVIDEDASAALDLTHSFDSEMVSAFSEIFNNIAIHGHKDSEGEIELEIEPIENGVRMTVRDNGVSFTPADQAEPDLDALPEGGMGLFIVRSFVDEFDYAPGEPNTLVLTKYFAAEPA